jgi:hypothetical protein
LNKKIITTVTTVEQLIDKFLTGRGMEKNAFFPSLEAKVSYTIQRAAKCHFDLTFNTEILFSSLKQNLLLLGSD